MSTFRSIHGLIQPRIPRAGKIRLGVKKTSGRTGAEYPAEVDYFVLDEDLPYRGKIVELYGAQPKRLLVTFLSNDPEEVFPISYKAYGKGTGLICRGDGRTALRATLVERRERDGTVLKEVKRDGSGKPVLTEMKCTCPLLEAKKCRPVGNLMVVLPRVCWEAYQIDTSSWHSMQNLRNDFAFMLAMSGGSVRGRLLWLERFPVETHGSGRKETHYPLRLRLPTPDEAQEQRRLVAGEIAKFAPVLGAGSDARYDTPATAAPGETDEVEDDLVRDVDKVDPGETGTNEGDFDDAGDDERGDDDGDSTPAPTGAAGMNQRITPDAPSGPLATREQLQEVKACWDTFVGEIGARGINKSAPSPGAAAGDYLETSTGFRMLVVLQDIRAKRLSESAAIETIAVLRKALDGLKGTSSTPPAPPRQREPGDDDADAALDDYVANELNL